MKEFYDLLLKEFSHQGWWPISSRYNPRNYSPKSRNERFEICIGAILTQNTSWNNVEKAITNLRNDLTPEKIKKLNIEKLKEKIKPAGYFNQKARKIKIFTDYFIKLKKTPTREELVSLWGIGSETADSILLYAYNFPMLVVDTYTKRIMKRIGFKFNSYEELQNLFMKNLPRDYKLFNEYHALLVKLGKDICLKKNPKCNACCLNKKCKKIVD